MKTKIAILTAAAALLTACGSGKTEHSMEQSSVAAPDLGEVVVNGKAYAYCNHTASNQASFKVALHSFVEGGRVLNDKMYAMLTELPADFKGSTTHLRMFRWKVDGSGVVSVDQTPLKFRLYNPSTGENFLQNADYVRWSDVSAAAQSLRITEPKDFFRRAFFVIDLQDNLAAYQGLMVVAYDQNNSEVDRVNTLLPLFDVDPNGYAKTPQGAIRPNVLQNLHPFQSSKGQSVSLTENQVRVQSLCAPWSAE